MSVLDGRADGAPAKGFFPRSATDRFDLAGRATDTLFFGGNLDLDMLPFRR